MKTTIFSAAFFAILSLTAACQPSGYARPNSGIELRMSSTVEGGELHSQGRLRIQGLDASHSAHVLVGPAAETQRLELPPGAYSVAYEPLPRPGTIADELGTTKVVSKNPFVLAVAPGRFTPLNIRLVDAEQAEPLARSGKLATSGER